MGTKQRLHKERFGTLNDLSIQCMTVHSNANKYLADRCLTDASLPCFFFVVRETIWSQYIQVKLPNSLNNTF